MSKFSKLSIFAIAIAIAVGFAFSISPAQAAGHEFYLRVSHRINGRALGLPEKDLPVDVYINGNLAIEDFTFGQTVSTPWEAGVVTVNVYFANTMNLVMSLGPVEIEGGSTVYINATLSPEKTPVLRAVVR